MREVKYLLNQFGTLLMPASEFNIQPGTILKLLFVYAEVVLLHS